MVSLKKHQPKISFQSFSGAGPHDKLCGSSCCQWCSGKMVGAGATAELLSPLLSGYPKDIHRNYLACGRATTTLTNNFQLSGKLGKTHFFNWNISIQLDVNILFLPNIMAVAWSHSRPHDLDGPMVSLTFSFQGGGCDVRIHSGSIFSASWSWMNLHRFLMLRVSQHAWSLRILKLAGGYDVSVKLVVMKIRFRRIDVKNQGAYFHDEIWRPRSRDDYVNTPFVDWVQKLWRKCLGKMHSIALGLGNLTFFRKSSISLLYL